MPSRVLLQFNAVIGPANTRPLLLRADVSDSSEGGLRGSQVRLLQRLQHPNIVQYMESFVDKEGNLW